MSQGDYLDFQRGPATKADADPSMEARIANFGYTAFASSSAEFGKFIAEDIQKWAKVNGGQHMQ